MSDMNRRNALLATLGMAMVPAAAVASTTKDDATEPTLAELKALLVQQAGELAELRKELADWPKLCTYEAPQTITACTGYTFDGASGYVSIT